MVRILYLSIVFYFPTENHTERHILFSNKIFKELTISFTQIFSQLMYVPLLLRIANDVEENPVPTVYDVVDPSQTICADFSQGCTRKFKENAGKQCVAMSDCSFTQSTKKCR